jgi:hypothetical protein
MKNIADLETALLNELTQWFQKQCRDPFKAFYLYYLPTTSEHDGHISIYSEKPNNPELKLACAERINPGMSIEQNFNYFRGNIGTLPVLSLKD